MGKNVKYNNKKFIDNLLSNEQTYIDILNRIKTLALSRFEWCKLPDGMDEEWLEKTLYYDGNASLLYDKNLGYINTRCSSNGYINIYGIPTKFNCYSFTYHTYRDLFTKIIYDNDGNIINDKTKECIYVKNNYDALPTSASIEMFAYRLFNAEKTSDINLYAQRTPVIILCDDKQRLTIENLYNQYDGFKPMIIGDKNSGLTADTIKAIKTDAPYIVDKVTNYKKEIWNELLTYLGINNIAVEKHERLITDEANQNNEVINLYLQSSLEPRQKACKQFNKLFGLDGTDKEISVRLRSDLHNIIKNTESIIFDYTKNKNSDKIENEIEGDE